MELFYVENTKKIPKCPECSEVVGFQINYENFSVSVQCKNGHNKDKIPFSNFENNYIKSSQIYQSKCHNCYKLLNENKNNYKCQVCNKLFCSLCINKHNKEKKHFNNVKFIQQYQMCNNHNEKYSFLCKNCKTYICNKCQKSHKKHSIESIIDIIPTKTKIDSINKSVEEYEKKINDITLSIKQYKNEIDRRFLEIEGFFNFLNNINDSLLNNFNYNYFDYYNYENFNYLYNSIKNESIFEIDRYKNYLFLKEDKDKKTDEDKEKDKLIINEKKSRIEQLNEFKNKRRENEKDYNFIQNLNKLEYLKDNIFYVFDKTFIKFFEFKNYSFNSILYYDLVKYRIYNIQPSKYSNTILLNFEFKKNIKILEYDLKKRTIKILKKEIKDARIGYPKHFYKCIDNNNGNIITQDNNGSIIWEKDKNGNYIKNSTIVYAQLSLQNINENLFCFQDNDYKLYFYDTINYDCNKIIDIYSKVDLIGIINNEIIIFNKSFGNILYIVDIKYLEIVQTIDNNKYYNSIKIKDNYLLIFFMETDNKLKIIKREYDINEKCFKATEIIEKDSKLNSFSKILILEQDYVAILNYNNMIILNI